MGEFYEAKRREETLRQNAYMQAFYESGSRLTHDIKNILQSVGTLVTAAEQTKNKDSEALLDLIRRQLPPVKSAYCRYFRQTKGTRRREKTFR